MKKFMEKGHLVGKNSRKPYWAYVYKNLDGESKGLELTQALY